jgi:hypothetical protein
MGTPVAEKVFRHNANEMITILLGTERALNCENNWLQEILPPSMASVFIQPRVVWLQVFSLA